jgi:magnesium-transporting ATPase (P-type)
MMVTIPTSTSIERKLAPCPVSRSWEPVVAWLTLRAFARGPNSLVRYIDTYRDPNVEIGGEEEEDMLGREEEKPWYAFWKKGSGYTRASLSDFATPADWLKTDLRNGLDVMEVERRRKFSGWNELTTEKENMFLKFVGFFRGPILYGAYGS